MFRLVTGLPGSSKTSHVIARYLKEKRPIYYRGIPFSEKGRELGWIELSDDETADWQNHLPHGAILIVDEAQQIWPLRAPSKPVPEALSILATHRKQGWDIEFITQDPTLLDTHARKLANEQYHYIRPFGAPFTVQYYSGTGYVNPSNRSDLNRCTTSRKKLPKHVWDLYKSAEIHTHKFKPPKILFVLVAAILLGGYCFWAFFDGFNSQYGAADSATVTTDHAPPGTTPMPHNATAYLPPMEWGEAFKADVRGLPFTAPIYREKAMDVQAVPVVHGCMSMRSDYSDCRCYTQQGTKIADMSTQMCKRVLKDGLFNHLASNNDDENRERRNSRRSTSNEGNESSDAMAGARG